MSSAKDEAIMKARKLISLLSSNGIDVSEAYLFGSVSMDKGDEFSDIDLAIVSKEFTGVPFYDAKKISRFRRAVDLKLEVHPFSLKDVLIDPPIFSSISKPVEFQSKRYRGPAMVDRGPVSGGEYQKTEDQVFILDRGTAGLITVCGMGNIRSADYADWCRFEIR